MKFLEKNLPNNVRVSVVHFHRGNSSRSARKGHSYMTLARLYDRESHELIGHGEAHCSRHDLPSRAKGRAVAIGRAMREAGFVHHQQPE